MNADGSSVTHRSDTTGKDYRPAWSPDDSQIIFVSERDGFPQIYAMNADGSSVQRVSDGTATDTSPIWKP
jgi:TolB protein